MSPTRSDAVLELGKRLASQLDASDDLLASWMAHYIAQQIKEAEEAPNEVKAAATDSCAKAILEIWAHRSSLPHRLRPLKDLGPALRTLASLDVDRTDHRYYPDVLRKTEEADVDESAKKWLTLASSLDYSARLLIQFALRAAARDAASQAEPWVELAAHAGADDDADGTFVRFILKDEVAEGTSQGHASLGDRLSRLESFVDLAQSVAVELRAQLGSDDARET